MGYGDLLYINQPGQGHQPAQSSPPMSGDWTPAGGGQYQGGGPTNVPGANYNIPTSLPWPTAPTPTDSIASPPPSYVSYSSPSSPAPQPVPPNPWMTNVTYTAPVGIKQADPDIIVFDDEVTTGTFLVDRFFEEIGGIELINISRSDIINGDLVTYTPIKNLSALRRQYNPNNIIAIASTAQSAFSRFKIDLLLRGINEPYIDDDGNLVIEVDTVNPDEFIEAEIATSGTINRIEL
jgi:hypothetical protein